MHEENTKMHPTDNTKHELNTRIAQLQFTLPLYLHILSPIIFMNKKILSTISKICAENCQHLIFRYILPVSLKDGKK